MPLKLVKRHGSESWYIRGTVRGVAVDESTKIVDKTLAEAVRAKREWEIVTRQIAADVRRYSHRIDDGGEARSGQ
jgi:integrase/recombinase XerD